MINLRFFTFVVVCFVAVNVCEALECYVCTNQEDNVEKCLNTIKTCESYEDACLTEIKWGSTPYWSQGALKQYYISKRCSRKDACIKARQRSMKYCTHIWYEDWACSECCLGDRCNYFVINGSRTSSVNHILLSAPVVLTFLLKFF